MAINPTSPHGPNRPVDPAELERARARAAESAQQAKPTTRPAADSDGEQADSVQVSSEARDLARDTEARPPKASVAPERMQQIGERLAAGYYDRPEVVDELARRLINHPDFRGVK